MDRKTSARYIHKQLVASKNWIIAHGLEDYPIIDVFVALDGIQLKVIPRSISYHDANACVVSFNEPTIGVASIA